MPSLLLKCHLTGVSNQQGFVTCRGISAVLATEMIAVCINAKLVPICSFDHSKYHSQAAYGSYVKQSEVCLLLILQRTKALATFVPVGLCQGS